MKQADLQWEWKQVLRGLEALQQVEATFQDKRFLFRSQLTAHASKRCALPESRYRLLCANSTN